MLDYKGFYRRTIIELTIFFINVRASSRVTVLEATDCIVIDHGKLVRDGSSAVDCNEMADDVRVHCPSTTRLSVL